MRGGEPSLLPIVSTTTTNDFTLFFPALFFIIPGDTLQGIGSTIYYTKELILKLLLHPPGIEGKKIS
jgi:hypothetical protein